MPKNTIDERLGYYQEAGKWLNEHGQEVESVKQALYQDLLELVGEDEPFKNLYQWNEAEPINLEKQRIRSKLKQYFGEER